MELTALLAGPAERPWLFCQRVLAALANQYLASVTANLVAQQVDAYGWALPLGWMLLISGFLFMIQFSIVKKGACGRQPN